MDRILEDEEELKVEVEDLNHIISGKDSEFEDTQEETKDSLIRVREENKMILKDVQELNRQIVEYRSLLET